MALFVRQFEYFNIFVSYTVEMCSNYAIRRLRDIDSMA